MVEIIQKILENKRAFHLNLLILWWIFSFYTISSCYSLADPIVCPFNFSGVPGLILYLFSALGLFLAPFLIIVIIIQKIIERKSKKV